MVLWTTRGRSAILISLKRKKIKKPGKGFQIFTKIQYKQKRDVKLSHLGILLLPQHSLLTLELK